MKEAQISELDFEEISVRNMISYYRVELESIEDGSYEDIAPNLSGHLKEIGLIEAVRKGKGSRIVLTDFAKSLLREIRAHAKYI